MSLVTIKVNGRRRFIPADQASSLTSKLNKSECLHSLVPESQRNRVNEQLLYLVKEVKALWKNPKVRTYVQNVCTKGKKLLVSSNLPKQLLKKELVTMTDQPKDMKEIFNLLKDNPDLLDKSMNLFQDMVKKGELNDIISNVFNDE
ncbi:hypothetical protein [Amphibacillus sediminis]|uniref:hypothetical protein n=1 Tax=Amphibacillus sediminis TaxID=360185 RepID=UPI0008318136|nr:hypothetical protein [Amphibacillus sediminis]